MKTLVIGDIHHGWYAAERILRSIAHDQAVLLGDYFDDFGDDPAMARDTALWLAHSIQQPKRIHLMGNHDLPYACGHILCPGFSVEKSRAINGVMTPELWSRLEFHCWADDWLLTHAGLHPIFCRHPDRALTVEYIRDFMAGQSLGAKMAMKAGERHWYFWMGASRGGSDYPVGGILWLDFRNEFMPITGLNQIVGHTPVWWEPPFYGESHYDYGEAQSRNYCIDTDQRFYALIEDGQCRIEEVPGFKKWRPTTQARREAFEALSIDEAGHRLDSRELQS